MSDLEVVVAQQHATVKSHELMTAVLPTIAEDDSLWGLLLDSKSRRMRSHLQRAARLVQEQQDLERERTLLTRLLPEHKMASFAIESFVARQPGDDWEESVRRWRAITHRNYKPWKLEDCLSEIETSRKELNAFLWSVDTQFIGSSFFGWRARRRLVPSRDAIQFSFEKTFRGFPVADFAKATWDMNTSHEEYNEVMIGDRGKGWMERVQEVTPDIWIVRCTERSPALMIDVHTFYLVSQSKTDTGFTQFVRSVHVPQVQKRTSQERDMWANNFVWVCFDLLNDDATDYRVHIGGTLSGQDTNYAAQMLVGTLAVLLRTERAATKRDLLSNI